MRVRSVMASRRWFTGALAGVCFIVGAASVSINGVEAARGAAPGQVLLHPGPSGPVAERIAWARGEAKANGWTKGFWVGFGIRRLMGERSTMGWYPGDQAGRLLTLDDLINGRKTPLEKRVNQDQAVRGTAAVMPSAARAQAALRIAEEPERRVIKEIAILLRTTSSETAFPSDIRISNLSCPFDFDDLPFIWVGMAADTESLGYLIPLYGKAGTQEDKLSVLRAIGLHRNVPIVVPFAERIMAGKESEEIRAEAAECLGEQSDLKALEILLKAIKGDPSREVRERAVSGLVEMELPAAVDALILLALNGADPEIRIEAIQGLADKATGETVKALQKISAADKDAKVQKEAIHALADLPRKSGLPYLISLVKTHADPRVRKEAVEAIGDIGGDEAVRVLIELARGKIH
jgi:HEAT repeat protein